MPHRALKSNVVPEQKRRSEPRRNEPSSPVLKRPALGPMQIEPELKQTVLSKTHAWQKNERTVRLRKLGSQHNVRNRRKPSYARI